VGEGEGESGTLAALAPGPNKIPVWATVKAGLATVYCHPRVFARGAWVWVLVCLAAQGLDALLFRSYEQADFPGVFATAAYLLGGTAFTVGWYRHVLLGQPVTSLSTVRFGRRELRFLGYNLLVVVLVGGLLVVLLLVWIAVGAVAKPAGYSDPLFIGFATVLTVATIIVLIIASRLSLYAPLAALDIQGDLLARAWRLSRGNGSRILAGNALIAVMFTVAIAIVLAILTAAMGHLVSSGRHAMVSNTVPATELLFLGVLHAVDLAIGFAGFAALAAFLSHAAARIGGLSLPLSSPEQLGDLAPASRPA
jgi:hypothetical protein